LNTYAHKYTLSDLQGRLISLLMWDELNGRCSIDQKVTTTIRVIPALIWLSGYPRIKEAQYRVRDLGLGTILTSITYPPNSSFPPDTLIGTPMDYTSSPVRVLSELQDLIRIEKDTNRRFLSPEQKKCIHLLKIWSVLLLMSRKDSNHNTYAGHYMFFMNLYSHVRVYETVLGVSNFWFTLRGAAEGQNIINTSLEVGSAQIVED